MGPEDNSWDEEQVPDLDEITRRREEEEEQRVYFIAPGFLTKFDRECGEEANLASVYVIDARYAPAPGLHLAPAASEDLASPPGKEGRGVGGPAAHAHASMLNFLMVPANKAQLEAGGPVLIFLMFKSVFLHPGLAPLAHKPAFAHALSKFIDVQVIAG